MGHVREGRDMCNQCFLGHMKEEDQSGNLLVDGKMIL